MMTAREARKRASQTHHKYDVRNSITEKVNCGLYRLNVNAAKLTPEVIDELRADGYKIRELMDKSGRLTHYAIEW